MYKYHCLNPIADIGLNNFTEDYTKRLKLQKVQMRFS